MGLRTKFNLVIFAAFVVGFGATSYLQLQMLGENARSDAVTSARIMMAAANAIRQYTVERITPLVGFERDGKFLPVSVPAYAAQTNFRRVQSEFPDYSYKEAVLNPTNPSDRAADWEADIIRAFRSGAVKDELVIERDTPTGPSFVLARPIAVGSESCLSCHSIPSVAPEAMKEVYGTANGFGWQLHEIIGAQVVSLPLSVPLNKARHTLLVFMALLIAVFAVMTIILNVLLHYVVVAPVTRMAEVAGKVSLGDFSSQEFKESGKDEIAALSIAFNRMRRSLESAMKLLEGSRR